MAGRESELRELVLALGASRRNTAFLELLNAVAVASNEASTVEEAMQTSLDEVCRLTAWPVGHVYMPSARMIPMLWFPRRSGTWTSQRDSRHSAR